MVIHFRFIINNDKYITFSLYSFTVPIPFDVAFKLLSVTCIRFYIINIVLKFKVLKIMTFKFKAQTFLYGLRRNEQHRPYCFVYTRVAKGC